MGSSCNACDGESRAKAELTFEREDTTPVLLNENKTDGAEREGSPLLAKDPIQEKFKADSRQIITGISDYIGSQTYIADGIIDGLQRHFFGKAGKWTAHALWVNYQPTQDELDLQFVDWTKDEELCNDEDLAMSRGFKNKQGNWQGRKVTCIFAIDEGDDENELIEIQVVTINAKGEKVTQTQVVSYEEEINMFQPREPICCVMLHGGKHNYIYFADGTFADPDEVSKVQKEYRSSLK